MKRLSQKHRGLVGRSDLIELLPDEAGSLEKFAGIVRAFNFELGPETTEEKSDEQNPPNNGSEGIQLRDSESQNGWTTFEPAPTQYWRVTGFHSKLSDQKAKDGSEPESDQITLGRSPAEILKAAAFDPGKSLPPQSLAARNYLLTKLRAIAPTRSSASQLDIPKAVDRISRGEFLRSVPRKHRRVWGQNICVIQDRARRLVPYWFDEDQVAQIVTEVYPECSVEVARLHDGHSQPEYCFPTSLVGLDWQPPAPGTLVLALTDLGGLARGDNVHHETVWLRIGDLLRENGNPAIALVPLHTNALSDLLQQRWQTIHWQQTTQHSGSEATNLKVDRLLEFLAPCIRLEPQLLRAVRLLTREFQSNPELESLVWQHPFLDIPHSVAGAVNAKVRDSLIGRFAKLDRKLRREILETLLAARQTLHPAVHFEEVVSLDQDSRSMVDAELFNLAEAYYCALAELGGDKFSTQTLAWIERCAHRLPKNSALPKRLSQAMLTLVKKTQTLEVSDAPPWMINAIPTATQANSEIRVGQRGGNMVLSHADLQSVSGPGDEPMASNPVVSLLVTIRCSEPVVWIHERRLLREALTEARFWLGGKKPSWVHRFGTDEYGAWCSFRVKDVEQILRWVPPGEFLMGSPENEEGRYEDEGPQHRVEISRGFWMFETQCTQELWSAVMATDPSHFKGDRLPVESVSWDDALKFNEALNRGLPGIGIHLPTEAQWEYSCRGPGTDQDKSQACYGELDEIAWWDGNSAGTTHDIGQKQCNGFGLYDMLGNVWEWCRDHAYRKYDQSSQVDPLYESGKIRASLVVRGGSWNGSAGLVRAAYRHAFRPEYRYSYPGFRCLSSPEPEAEPSREAAMSGSKSQRGGSPQNDVRELPQRGRNFLGERKGASPPVPSVGDSGAPHFSRMIQLRDNSTATRISLPATCVMQMETDCEILSLELAPPPPWAVASGRDRYGLWAEFELKGVRQRLRWIPPGQFLMGSVNKPEYSWIEEQPQHSVTLTHGFWMFDTPCTQQFWKLSGIKAEFNFPGDQRPVETVSFEQVAAFVDQINSQVTELHLRLPTESEWEYSCRAGNAGDRYGELDDIAWYNANSGGHTQDVKQKKPNAWGLYDMLGNVWEWCLDGPRKYSKESVMNPFGEARSVRSDRSARSLRVVRGGSWYDSAGYVRAAYRDARPPVVRNFYLGFRCLSSPEPSPEPAREAAMSDSKSPRGGSPQDGARELPPRGKSSTGFSRKRKGLSQEDLYDGPNELKPM